MCFDYDEYPEFINKSIVKTRKPHRCDGCGKPIPVGDLAVNLAGKFDGEMFSDYACGSCELTSFRIHRHELKEGCSWHESWIAYSDISEHLHHTEMKRSSYPAGQRYLAFKRKQERASVVSTKKGGQ